MVAIMYLERVLESKDFVQLNRVNIKNMKDEVIFYTNERRCGFVTTLQQLSRETGLSLYRLRILRKEGMGHYKEWMVAFGKVERSRKGYGI
jgi:hypothetical protein